MRTRLRFRFGHVGGIDVNGPSSSCAASLILLLLLLQAQSRIIIMAPGLRGWVVVVEEEVEEEVAVGVRRGRRGCSQIVNGNCGLCQSAADGEHIFKRNPLNDMKRCRF